VLCQAATHPITCIVDQIEGKSPAQPFPLPVS
jgi:hypothetical protein